MIGIMTTLFYQSIVLLSPALALQATAGLPLWISLALIGSVGSLYTAIGGFKSVIWTDAFQGIMVFVGIIAIVIKACVEVGGLEEVWRLSEEGGRINMDKFSLDPRVRHTQWSLVIGFFLMMSTTCYSQATIQRISSMKSVRDAKIAFLVNIPFHIIYGCISTLVGLSIYAYYSYRKCDPLKAGLITNKNQLAPYFVLHAMTSIPGMAGLYIGVLCCGSLSSLSSGINAMAANTVQDILPSLLRSASEATITFVTKLFVGFYGSLAIGLAYLAQSMDGPVTQLASAVFGAFGAPILGIFVMGAAVPWANKFGALAGVVVSLALNLWIGLGSAIQAAPLKTLPPITTENCFEPADMLNSSSYKVFVTDETTGSVYRNVSEYNNYLGSMNYTAANAHEPATFRSNYFVWTSRVNDDVDDDGDDDDNVVAAAADDDDDNDDDIDDDDDDDNDDDHDDCGDFDYVDNRRGRVGGGRRKKSRTKKRRARMVMRWRKNGRKRGSRNMMTRRKRETKMTRKNKRRKRRMRGKRRGKKVEKDKEEGYLSLNTAISCIFQTYPFLTNLLSPIFIT
ncbi:sodium-coupled monocarboxylate transporter 1 [Plakobranchus ocellatus]|uniref:Sodium-coupled monocarboxylate transporter 1 n=1 Tax=Plakobranchus ocellatus TaxID=259542 RepID=A0AAV4DKI9_9GAST|nr:sodium-coupled monocarboxylate transporter 1 [Plakobranchus ocellatus]